VRGQKSKTGRKLPEETDRVVIDVELVEVTMTVVRIDGDCDLVIIWLEMIEVESEMVVEDVPT